MTPQGGGVVGESGGSWPRERHHLAPSLLQHKYI